MGSFPGMSSTGLVVGVMLVVLIPIVLGRINGGLRLQDLSAKPANFSPDIPRR